MRKTLILLAVLVFAVLAGTARAAPLPPIHNSTWQAGPLTNALEAQLGQLRVENHRLHRQLTAHGRWVRRLQAVVRDRVEASPSGLEFGFLCIHRFEGDWRSATGNGYYGGLQMDRDFQRSYGLLFYDSWGTADHWPVSAQLATGMRAYLGGRGFYPWPQTARMCGLLP